MRKRKSSEVKVKMREFLKRDLLAITKKSRGYDARIQHSCRASDYAQRGSRKSSRPCSNNHPIDDDDISSPPTSAKLKPFKHPHTLPNGVRLRLAFGTFINDLLARQAPHPAYRQPHRTPPYPKRSIPRYPRRSLVYQKHSYHLPQYPGRSPHNHNPSHHTATCPPRRTHSNSSLPLPHRHDPYTSNPQ